MTTSSLKQQPSLLMLTQRAPFPPDRGDRIRAYHLLRQLSEHWQISLACLNDEPVQTAQREELQRWCTRVAIEENQGGLRWLRACKSAFLGRSLTEGLFQSVRLEKTVSDWDKTSGFDAVLVYCSSMMQFVDSDRFAQTPMLVDLVDVDSEKWSEHASRTRSLWRRAAYCFESRRVRKLECEISKRANAIALVSDDEADLFRQSVGSGTPLRGIGNGVSLPRLSEPQSVETKVNGDQPVELLFVGVLDYYPNVEGIEWFVENVLPLVRHDVRLKIVGRKPIGAVLRLARHRNVEVFGDVPDVSQYLRDADIVVAPLHQARGIQNKVLEAMASGLPVVLTFAAATGIDGQDQEHFCVADTADAFATQVNALVRDHQLRLRIGKAARSLVESEYDWETRLQPMLELLQNMLPTHTSEPMAISP